MNCDSVRNCYCNKVAINGHNVDGQRFYLVLITADLNDFISLKRELSPSWLTAQYSSTRSKCGQSYTQVDIEQYQEHQQMSLVLDHTSNERIKENSTYIIIQICHVGTYVLIEQHLTVNRITRHECHCHWKSKKKHQYE